MTGGQPFSRGALFHLLHNRLYYGEIGSRGTRLPGLHRVIIEADLFGAVQTRLDGKARQRSMAREAVARSALTGRIFDAHGHAMSPTFAYGKGGTLYHYYVSAPLQQGRAVASEGKAPRRVSAPALEAALTAAQPRLFAHDARIAADALASLNRIEVRHDGLDLSLPVALLRRLAPKLEPGEQAGVDPADLTLMRLVPPLRLGTRAGRTEVVGAAVVGRKPDPVLIRALCAAHRLLATGRHGRPVLNAAPLSSDRRRLIRLAFLAPDLQRATLAGEQPRGITHGMLKDDRALTTSLAKQRQMFASRIRETVQQTPRVH